MIRIATILFTLCITTASTASSSSGSHSANNYSSGLNIVKENSLDNGGDEYVTDFYRQKRLAKREELANTNRHSHHGSEVDDHSLDHYFDHEAILTPHHRSDRPTAAKVVSKSNVSDKQQRDQMAFLPKHRQQQRFSGVVASAVRGGGSLTRKHHDDHDRNDDTSSNNDRFSSSTSHAEYHHKRRNHHHASRNAHHRVQSSFAARDRYGLARQQYNQRHDSLKESDLDDFHYSDHDSDDLQEEYDDQDDDDDDQLTVQSSASTSISSSSSSQANLLRIACSLRLNSDSSHHHHHSSSSSKSTPIAAYVDTGAQVTVISASAARKAGILHLIDRRYAGRATGVGHCRVLGRIPAKCVHFLLGNNEHDDDDGEMIEMDGPALTVLEGTVTPGVDMLLGLDVLQDWEATIQIGGRRSCIMVRKRGVVEPVVLPFLVGGGAKKHHGQRGRKRRMQQEQQQQQHDAVKTHQHGRRRHQRKHISKQQQLERDDREDEDDFSPVSSDVESDLDILDQSEFTHEFPDEGRRRVTQCSDEIVNDIEREDELLGVRHSHHHHLHDARARNDVDEEESEDSSDDDDEEEENFDMSGL